MNLLTNFIHGIKSGLPVPFFFLLHAIPLINAPGLRNEGLRQISNKGIINEAALLIGCLGLDVNFRYKQKTINLYVCTNIKTYNECGSCSHEPSNLYTFRVVDLVLIQAIQI